MAVFTTDFPAIINSQTSDYSKSYYETFEAMPPDGWERIMTEIGPQNKPHYTRVSLGSIPIADERPGPMADFISQAISERYRLILTLTECGNRFDTPIKTMPKLSAGYLARISVAFARAIYERVNVRAWALLNGAFNAATFTTPDAKAICANDHPREDGGVIDNLAALAFSTGALTTVMAQRDRFVDPQGKIYARGGGSVFLVTPVELTASANAAVKANWQLEMDATGVAAIGDDFNPHKTVVPLSSRYLTNAADWFVIDQPIPEEHGLLVWLETPPQLKQGTNEDKDYFWLHSSCEVGVGCGNYYQIVGSDAP